MKKVAKPPGHDVLTKNVAKPHGPAGLTKKVAIILSGCGNKDGAEITEAVSLIVNLSQASIHMEFFAPDLDFKAKNFLEKDVLLEKRNILIESARITRSNIRNLTELKAEEFDGIAFPGGYGVALHLCNWAEKGSACQVLPLVEKAVLDFFKSEKPIAAICIAPVLIAKVLGSHQVELTIGNDKETAQEVLKTGAIHIDCPVEDYVTDRDHKIITTPAYMYDAKPHQVFNGISGLVKEFSAML